MSYNGARGNIKEANNMTFKLLILVPEGRNDTSYIRAMPEKLRSKIPTIEVALVDSTEEAKGLIADMDAAFGDIHPELFGRAKKLKWIACPQAGPREGYYHEALVESSVVVTNTREIYNDHISAQIMAYVLSFARGLHLYLADQRKHRWNPGYSTTHLPGSTVLVVGVGGIGSETARLCSEFGMRVIGVDPRLDIAPEWISELVKPNDLHTVLPKSDFVVVTVPETPDTQGMFAENEFKLMKKKGILINIGRGRTVVLDDLVSALESGEIGGAALDVFEKEPLPANHKLWGMTNVMLTPHVAGIGPYLEDRRSELFIENCIRFSEGEELLNIVDKSNWY